MSRTYRKKTETKQVTSKDRAGNIKGKGSVTVYAESKPGFHECNKTEGYADIMWLRNRQAVSQVLNVNRRDTDEISSIVRETKQTRAKQTEDNKAAMDAELKAVEEKYAALAKNQDTEQDKASK